jgi:hypothetical protein
MNCVGHTIGVDFRTDQVEVFTGKRQINLQLWFAGQVQGSPNVGRLATDDDKGLARCIALGQDCPKWL